MPIEQEVLEVEGVMCHRCVERIAAALRDVDGLLGASATMTGEVTVAYEEAGVRDRVARAIEDAGFTVAGTRTTL